MNKIEIKTLVTQTFERTFTINVPEDESEEDIKELFESGNIGNEFITLETDGVDVSQKFISTTNLTSIEQKKLEDEAAKDEMETKKAAKQDGVGRFA